MVTASTMGATAQYKKAGLGEVLYGTPASGDRISLNATATAIKDRDGITPSWRVPPTVICAFPKKIVDRVKSLRPAD